MAVSTLLPCGPHAFLLIQGERRVEKLRPVSGPLSYRDASQGSCLQKQGADSQRTFLLLLCSALGPAWMGLESPLPGKSSPSGEAGRIPTLHPFITRSCSKHSLSTSHTPGSEWPTGRRAQKRQQHLLSQSLARLVGEAPLNQITCTILALTNGWRTGALTNPGREGRDV